MSNFSLKPPFKWTGGKNRMWGAYLPIFFPDGEFNRFVDMFFGAGSVSIWISELFPNAEIIVNDANTELIDMYKVMQHDYDRFEVHYIELVNKFLEMEYDGRKSMYYDLRDRHAFEETDPHVDASELYFMLKVNFNGMWKAYKKMDYKYSTPPGTLTQKTSFFDVQQVRKFASFIQNCTLLNGDFEITEPFITDKTFTYADPPYRDSVVTYQDTFNEDDQVRLVNYLKSCPGYIAESNKEIGDKFWETNYGDGYNINIVPAKYTAGRGKSVIKVDEVLITNYNGNSLYQTA